MCIQKMKNEINYLQKDLVHLSEKNIIGFLTFRIVELQEIITSIRNIRQGKQISPKESLGLSVKANSGIDYRQYETIISRMANINAFHFVKDKIDGAVAFMASKDEFYIPLAINIDKEAEKERLEKEKEYLTGFLKSVEAKLGNERFMNNAKPDIIENELKKKADALAKLEIINKSLEGLAG